MAELPPSITVSPLTLTPRPAPAVLPSWSSEWGWVVGQYASGKLPSTHSLPAPCPSSWGVVRVWFQVLPMRKRSKGQNSLERHLCLALGGGWGWMEEETAPPTHLLGFKVRWQPNRPPKRPRDTWRDEQSAPYQGLQVQTVRRRHEAAPRQRAAEGPGRHTQIRCNGSDTHRWTQTARHRNACRAGDPNNMPAGVTVRSRQANPDKHRGLEREACADCCRQRERDRPGRPQAARPLS